MRKTTTDPINKTLTVYAERFKSIKDFLADPEHHQPVNPETGLM